ncbi:MAG TPA: serine/threonine-protein kinase [Opitutaceae bacterium]|nr:serine/threonine-protein kinase [Opitutaceae bacterium]
MTEIHICPTCSAPTMDGICRACAFTAALEGLVTDGAGGEPREETPGSTSPEGYQLLHRLGAGAMGVVWLARERKLDRLVALKIIGPTADPRLGQRLIREGQAAARLRHPHIVPVHTLGTCAHGNHLVMDFAPGGDLRERLGRGLPSVRLAAEWSCKLADALAHAHAAGILHRDIKPSNVLLSEDGEPQLADFGLAVALEGGGDLTSPGQVAGTAAFMAPELLAGADHATVASDVYSLGALLYECLTGRPPFIGDSAAAIFAQLPNTDPPAPRLLRTDLPRDVETICLKCLEKTPARRYASAAALRDDLSRFLRDEPIEARPVGPAGRAVRWCRRRPATAALAGTTALLVLALAIGGPLVALRLARANARAEAEAATSRAVNDFLQSDLLAQAAPDNQPDRDIKLRTILDRAADTIEGRFADRPLVEASLRVTLADTYKSLGEYPSAKTHRERALAIYERELGPRSQQTIETMIGLATDVSYTGKNQEAVELLERAIPLSQEVHGPERAETLDALSNLAGIYRRQSKLARAEEIYLRVLAIHRRKLGPGHEKTLEVMNNLGVVCNQLGQFADAEALQRETLEHFRRIYGPEHPKSTTLMDNLGVVLFNQGKLAEAEVLSREAWETRKRVLGPEHPVTLISMNNLARICARAGEDKRGEAEALFTQVVEIRGRVSGPDHPDVFPTLMNLGRLYVDDARLVEAEAMFRRSAELAQRIGKRGHIFIFSAQDALGDALGKQGRYYEAEALLRESLETQSQFAPDTWRHAQTKSRLGAVLVGLKRFDEAEPLLLAGYEELLKLKEKIPTPDRDMISEAASRVGHLYAEWNQPERAQAWRDTLAAAQADGRE